MKSVGVDAWKKGWVAVRLDDGRFDAAYVHRDLAEVVNRAEGAVVAVDIPLGLTEEGWRECDQLAQKALKGAAAKVFPIPPRAVVEIEDYAVANAECKRSTGQGLTRQSHALFPRIREADRLRGAHGDRLYEVHPELSFQAMAGRSLEFSKKTWAGQTNRRKALAEVGIELPDDLGEAGRVPVDDVLDAAAAAWSAHRIARGEAVRSPERQQSDGRGRPIEIWH